MIFVVLWNYCKELKERCLQRLGHLSDFMAGGTAVFHKGWRASNCMDISLLVIVRRYGCLPFWSIRRRCGKVVTNIPYPKSCCKKQGQRNVLLKIMIKYFEIVRFWLSCVLAALLQRMRIFWYIAPKCNQRGGLLLGSSVLTLFLVYKTFLSPQKVSGSHKNSYRKLRVCTFRS